MKRVILLGAATLALLLVLAVPVLAATPQDIYNDYAADGDLGGTYTRAEIQAYLDDATVHQYGSQGVLGGLDALVTSVLGVWQNNPSYTWAQVLAAIKGGTDSGRDKFPFTGFEMLLAGLGGLALIGGGVAIRRTSK